MKRGSARNFAAKGRKKDDGAKMSVIDVFPPHREEREIEAPAANDDPSHMTAADSSSKSLEAHLQNTSLRF
jgi:hypothetical protein